MEQLYTPEKPIFADLCNEPVKYVISWSQRMPFFLILNQRLEAKRQERPLLGSILFEEKRRTPGKLMGPV